MRGLTFTAEPVAIGEFEATFGIRDGSFSVEWAPDVPRKRPDLLPLYLAARNLFALEVERRFHVRVGLLTARPDGAVVGVDLPSRGGAA